MSFTRGVLAGIGLLAVGIAVYAIAIAGIWLFQDRLMFGRRTHDFVETPATRQWPFEEVWLDVGNEKTFGWWLPVYPERGAVLFSHGNGRNISGYLDDCAFFRDAGFSVLLYDYGGYGRSTGKPSESRCYADIRAAWDYLTRVRKIPPERVILAGCSMGGGVTADLAAQVHAGGVILESTFTSIPDVMSAMHWWIPARLIMRTQFRNIDKVVRITSPVLVAHSRDDAVVPFEQGRTLYERISAPKRFVELRGSHGKGKFASREVYEPAIQEFLRDKGTIGPTDGDNRKGT
ncbi:MAG TPA: alpha/beta fold hydrolase [Candidatus Hydrogenedentes bacterium]|nr:alpha/beta fold hydrolase [Candidatus Hydrogenedentota bacterium]